MVNKQAADPLLTAWNETLARRADDPAVFDTRERVQRTFAQIESESRELEENELREFKAGDVVGIQIGNHPAWPAWLLACLRRELVALPLERNIAEQERDNALAVCHAAAVVTTKLTRLDAQPIEWGENPPRLLKLTSGTTAAPRAIRFRSEQLLADCIQICDTMGITDGDRSFAVIPLSHSYGFSNVLTSLLARGVPMVLSNDRMPRAMLDDLVRTNATVLHGMPVFYQAFCEMESVPTLRELRLCVSAGAPLPLAVAQKFREKFERSIHSFYGSSECGGICYDREARLDEQGFVGEAMNNVTVNLLDPESAMSRIEVRSAAAGDGYFPFPDEEKLRPGRFVPNDLLTRTADGFRIVGRVSDVINVAGKKVNPAEVEAALLAVDGVHQAVVFGRGSTLRNEEVAACVVTEPSVTEPQLLEFCRRRLSGWQVPKRIFFLREIPVTERGKISRRALAEKFAN
jgi:acyl-CoA synthetase (AMP-forming)/AMP-acid ligase II